VHKDLRRVTRDNGQVLDDEFFKRWEKKGYTILRLVGPYLGGCQYAVDYLMFKK
jgi:hypothetical protein